MPITLKPEAEKLVEKKVATGAYPSNDAVIQAGLELLDQRDRKIEDLRKDLQIAIDQVDRGEYSTLDREEFIAEIKSRAKAG